MQKIHWKYLLKIWLSILFIAPFLADLTLILSRENSSKIGGLVEIFPLTFLLSLICSTPTFVILIITDYIMKHRNKDIRDIKFVLISFLTLGTITTFLTLFGSQDFEITFAYTFIALTSSIFYKLEGQ